MGELEMKLKYPVKKYILPWCLFVINGYTLIRLGNHAFTAMVLFSALITYGVLKLASKQIEKKDAEIEKLKSSMSDKDC